MRVIRLAAVVTVAVLGLAPQASAQDAQAPKGLEVVTPPSRRSGWWGTIGMGVGSETFTVPDSFASPGWLAAPTFNSRIGGTPSAHFRAGGEFISWFNSEGEVNQSLGGLLAIGQVYPSTTMGFFLKGGGGFAWNSFAENYYCTWYVCTASGYSEDSGFMWSAGAGWDIPVSRKLDIVPTVDYYEFYFGGRYTADYTEKLWNFGISVGFP